MKINWIPQNQSDVYMKIILKILISTAGNLICHGRLILIRSKLQRNLYFSALLNILLGETFYCLKKAICGYFFSCVCVCVCVCWWGYPQLEIKGSSPEAMRNA